MRPLSLLSLEEEEEDDDDGDIDWSPGQLGNL